MYCFSLHARFVVKILKMRMYRTFERNLQRERNIAETNVFGNIIRYVKLETNILYFWSLTTKYISRYILYIHSTFIRIFQVKLIGKDNWSIHRFYLSRDIRKKELA